VSLVICVIIARNSARKFLCLGLALVLSGALGNAWDRFTIGVVVDFLDFHLGSYHWPAFNVADICICCGAGIVVLAEFFGKKN
jgi:signal peptidase II